MALKLKTVDLNGTTYAEVKDGKPLFIDDTDKKEIAFDADHSASTITRLNGEAKGHREAKEAAEAKLKTFDGITDPAAALKAMETVKNLEEGQLVTAGKVEEIKKAAKEAAEKQVEAATKGLNEKITGLTTERDSIRLDYFNEKVGGAFARSKFINDKTTVAPDMLQSMFGSRFKIENGKIVAVGADGQPLYSRVKNGDLAEFEEAIEIIVGEYPHRDRVLKGTGGGSGSEGGGGGGGGNGKTMPRAEFEKLAPALQAAKMREGYVLTDG